MFRSRSPITFVSNFSLRKKARLLESAEKGEILEGMLALIESENRSKILARISSIIPYNAFYTEGDPWSEARRKGLPIPEEIARQYEICELDLLIELPRGEIVMDLVVRHLLYS